MLRISNNEQILGFRCIVYASFVSPHTFRRNYTKRSFFDFSLRISTDSELHNLTVFRKRTEASPFFRKSPFTCIHFTLSRLYRVAPLQSVGFASFNPSSNTLADFFFCLPPTHRRFIVFTRGISRISRAEIPTAEDVKKNTRIEKHAFYTAEIEIGPLAVVYRAFRKYGSNSRFTLLFFSLCLIFFVSAEGSSNKTGVGKCPDENAEIQLKTSRLRAVSYYCFGDMKWP